MWEEEKKKIILKPLLLLAYLQSFCALGRDEGLG